MDTHPVTPQARLWSGALHADAKLSRGPSGTQTGLRHREASRWWQSSACQLCRKEDFQIPGPGLRDTLRIHKGGCRELGSLQPAGSWASLFSHSRAVLRAHQQEVAVWPLCPPLHSPSGNSRHVASESQGCGKNYNKGRVNPREFDKRGKTVSKIASKIVCSSAKLPFAQRLSFSISSYKTKEVELVPVCLNEPFLGSF